MRTDLDKAITKIQISMMYLEDTKTEHTRLFLKSAIEYIEQYQKKNEKTREEYDTEEFLVTITSEDPVSDLYDALNTEKRIKAWVIENVVFNVKKEIDEMPTLNQQKKSEVKP